jgi:hypothetical protein
MDQPAPGGAPGRRNLLSNRCLTLADTFRCGGECHTVAGYSSAMKELLASSSMRRVTNALPRNARGPERTAAGSTGR